MKRQVQCFFVPRRCSECSSTTIFSRRRELSSVGDDAAELGTIASSLGRRAFVVCGSRTIADSDVFVELLDSLVRADIDAVLLGSIAREPEVGDVDQFTARLLLNDPGNGDFVLAIGGGSAIDLGKAVAAMATNGESSTVRDYLEGVGRGLKVEHAPLPVLAVPTTAGTGSEATKNAVISSRDPPFKKSLRSDLMVPRVVLIDPELTMSVPPRTDGIHRHGRDHAVDREFYLAPREARAASTRDPGAATRAAGGRRSRE